MVDQIPLEAFVFGTVMNSLFNAEGGLLNILPMQSQPLQSRTWKVGVKLAGPFACLSLLSTLLDKVLTLFFTFPFEILFPK